MHGSDKDKWAVGYQSSNLHLKTRVNSKLILIIFNVHQTKQQINHSRNRLSDFCRDPPVNWYLRVLVKLLICVNSNLCQKDDYRLHRDSIGAGKSILSPWNFSCSLQAFVLWLKKSSPTATSTSTSNKQETAKVSNMLSVKIHQDYASWIKLKLASNYREGFFAFSHFSLRATAAMKWKKEFIQFYTIKS